MFFFQIKSSFFISGVIDAVMVCADHTLSLMFYPLQGSPCRHGVPGTNDGFSDPRQPDID